MRRAKLLLLVLAFGAIATLAVTAADGDGPRARLLEIKGTDPERYSRIRKNYERFRAMPAAQQERLRTLDRQLHEEDSQTRARLMQVMDDYAAWFTRLPDEDRRRIQSTTTADEKLRVVREIRNRQWVAQLPQAARDELKAAPANKKQDVLDKWRADERKQRDEWASARRAWDVFGGERPKVPFQDAMGDMTAFVEARLLPLLTPSERSKLDDARRTGNPFHLVRVVTELAEAHPVLGLELKYTTFRSLPDDYRAVVAASGIKVPEGAWPAYPLAVTDWVRSTGKGMKQQLGPATAKEFPPATADAIRKLQDRLPDADRKRLDKADGLWPEYPRVLHDLALKYKAAIPELTLPGDPQRWDRFKPTGRGMSNFPEPPDHLLREFALKLAMKDPNAPSYSNPSDREELKRRFYDQYKEMLERLRQQDHLKWDFKKGKK
jgi:hypothetical protein